MTVYCWDATLLVHAARVDRLDTLGTYLPQGRHVVTDVVVDELRGVEVPPWLEQQELADLAVIRSFSRWGQIVGTSGGKNAGEAAVLAWSEVHGATAVIDDRTAVAAARTHGAEVHGSLAVLARGVTEGVSTPQATSTFCDILLGTDIRWPFTRGSFAEWAAREGLLSG